MESITKTFFLHAQRTPDKCAIWCEGESLTYGQLATLVCRLSNAMVARGVRRGDSIAVLLPNTIEFVALMLAVSGIGGVLVPLNISLSASAMISAFRAANVKHGISTLDTLKSLLAFQSKETLLVEGMWITLDEGLSAQNGYPKIDSLGDLLKEGSPNGMPETKTHVDDPFILTMTSGSTGNPKPIILTQKTKINRVAASVQLYGVTNTDKTLAATPLYHSLAERLVLIPLLTGGTSVLMARFSPSEWLQCVAEQSISFTIAVSSQLGQIAEQLAHSPTNVSSLRCVVSSSALLEPRFKSDLLSRLACDFHECYGASEIAIASNLDGLAAQTKLKSVGNAAPGVDIKILSDNGEIAPTGESGEIVCKTPMLFGGYFKRPELTRQSMWGDYFKTGDVGKLDEEGFLYFLGRQKEIVITGGINVYPSDIESVLTEHPSVLECAVFPFPDDRLGEIVAVAMVPKDPDTFNKRKVRLHCANYLADFQQPRKFFIVDALPKNGMGKIMKHALIKTFVVPKS